MALGLTPYQIIEKGTHPQLVIADGWERIELKHIATVQNGYAFSSKLFNHSEGLPLIRIRDIFSTETQNLYSGEYKDDFLVTKGDILIGMDGDFKVSKWPGKKGLLNQRVCRILFNSNNYEKEFLFLCIQPYLDAIHSETSAVTVKHLSSRTINDIPFPLPPLIEQKAIVKKIEELFSSLDSGIADLKKAQNQLVIYRQAVLKKAFEGELTKEWRTKQTNLPSADVLLKQIKEERQNHFEQQLADWKNSVKVWEKNEEEGKKPKKPKIIIDYPEIEQSSTLPVLNLGELVFQISNKMMPNEAPEFAFIGMDCLEKNALKPHFTYKFKEFKSAGNWFNTNHVLYGRLRPYLNKVYQAEYEGVASGEFIILETIKSFDPNYLKLILHQQDFVHWANKQSAGDKPRVKYDQIALYPIKVPTKQEQRQIILEIESRLSVCDKVEESIKESLQRAIALRQSILKKAFEGSLLSEAEIARCKQHKNYEPASVLLEKIKEEKSGITTTTKKTQRKKIKTIKKKAVVKPKISTDIQAGVIAKVIQLHEDNPNYLDNLTHVKCEKISHLVEYHLQIPLGRVPVKDAAGPDDYNHLKKVEHRASMAGYFKVVKKEIGHTYSSSRNITKAIDNLESKVTAEQKKQLDNLINLFLKFDLERAEIIATLYAGWNNLLIDGKMPTDDEIVYESRENWSKRKLTIDRERFYKALQWMRKDEISIVPIGFGTKVLKPNKQK